MRKLKLIIIPALAAVLLVFFFRNVRFSEIKTILSGVYPPYVLLFILSLLVQYVIRAWRWRLLLSPYKQRVAFRSVLNFTLIGFMISFTLPGRLGEVLRPVLLAQKERIRKSQAIATVVNERLLDLLSVGLIFVLALRFLPASSLPLLRTLRLVALLALPAVAAVFVMVYFLNHEAVFHRVARLVRFCCRAVPLRWREAVADFLLHFLQALKMDLSVRQYLALLGQSLLLWLSAIPFFWLLMQGFADATLRSVTLPACVPYFTITFIAAAVPTPGMAGSYDYASRLALTGLFAVNDSVAVAYTLLVHFLIVVVPVLLGAFALWAEGLRFGGLRRTEATEAHEVSTLQ